jgi:hypothetical protein
MRVGDLVKIKWTTFASKRRADRFFPGSGCDAPGLVINKLDPTELPAGFVPVVEVMFPQRSGKVITFVETDLEVIDEPRNN